MANLLRSPMSGSDWTRYELHAYNIEVVPEDVATFFGNAQLPPSTISPEILVNVAYPAAGLPKDERLFFNLLEDVMRPPPGDLEVTAISDFVAHLLGLLGYDEPNRFIRTREDIPLFMDVFINGVTRRCRPWSVAKPARQCGQCLRWGHSTHHCRSNTAYCSKCAEHHDTSLHPKQYTNPDQCINCLHMTEDGYNHNATSNVCPFYKARYKPKELAKLLDANKVANAKAKATRRNTDQKRKV